MYTKLKAIDKLMKENGIQIDPKTTKEYFSGYCYKQLYDWDQYFEGIVQLYLGWSTDYPKNAVEIFLDYQDESGFSPRGVGYSNGCEEQNAEMVKPFLAQITLLVYNRDGDIGFLNEYYYQKMKKYLLYWVKRALECGNLAYWNSSVHTGMDNQHERAGFWNEKYCLGVDLNCYLVREFNSFSIIAGLKDKKDDATYFKNFANKTTQAIQERMWDENDGIYYDINKNTNKMIKVKYIGTFTPMWLGIATKDQASILVERHLENVNEFKRGFLYPVMSADEKGYSEQLLETDLSYLCNWRANTWIPTNYILFHGLKKYGYNELAKNLANVTYNTVCKIGNYEYFTTESERGCGCYPFWGWTLLAYFMPFENMMNFDPTEIEIQENDITLL